MYQETVKYPPAKPWQNMLLVFVIVASIIVITMASNALASMLPNPLWSLLPLLFAALLGWLLLRQRIVEYRYTISDGILLFNRVLGRRDKRLAEVELASVRWLYPADRRPAAAPRGNPLSTATFTMRAYASRTHVLWYEAEKGLRCIRFQPSEQLVGRLEGAINPARGAEG